MAILPDKILTDSQIANFVQECNECQKNLTGESLFQIPDPALPGVGLLISLQIRSLERSLAASFAPIFIGKKIIDDARESPLSFLRIVREGLSTIRDLLQNPLQTLLDETINRVLEQFPFPIRFIINDSLSSLDTSQLRNLIESSSSISSGDQLKFDYDILFSSRQIPLPGEITTISPDLQTSRIFLVNNQSKESDLPPFANLESGDIFTLFSEENIVTYRISSKKEENIYFSLSVEKLASTENINPDQNKFFDPGFKKGISLSQNLVLRNFLTSDGRIILPFSVFGLNFIGFNKLAIELGNFNSLSETAPIKRVVERLQLETGLNFQTVLSDMLNGIFPVLNFESLGIGNVKEENKEKLISLARLIQIGATNPFFLIKTILNYLKLLLLPLKLIIDVLKGIGSKITNPASLIRTVINGITNPLNLVCDLISIAIIEFLTPYIQTPITAVMPFSEALVDPTNASRGIRPLIRDLVCGAFFRKLKDYRPNESFFNEQNRLIGEDKPPFQFGPNISYFISNEAGDPSQGEIRVNSNIPSDVRFIKVNTISNTVDDATPFLANVNPGELIRIIIGGEIGEYRVNSNIFIISSNGNFFEYAVQPFFNVNTNSELINQNPLGSVSNQGIKAFLNINNPDVSFLFIIEKYLPVKLIAVWQGIKGILSIIICIAARIPTIFTSVIRSLFGREEDISVTDQNPISLDPQSSLESVTNILELLYGREFIVLNRDPSIMSKIIRGNSNNPELTDFINLAIDLIGNNSSLEGGIEQPFYELYQNLVDSGNSFQISSQNINFNIGTNENFPNFGLLDVRDLGNLVKILSVAFFELRNFEEDTRVEGLLIPRVFVVREGRSEIIFNGGILLDVLREYRIFRDLFIFNNRIGASSARFLISTQIRFITARLLPTLNTSS